MQYPVFVFIHLCVLKTLNDTINENNEEHAVSKIEDIVKRKAGVGAESIVITTLNE